MINLMIIILFHKTDRHSALSGCVASCDFCNGRSSGAVIAHTDLLLIDELHVINRHGAVVLNERGVSTKRRKMKDTPLVPWNVVGSDAENMLTALKFEVWRC